MPTANSVTNGSPKIRKAAVIGSGFGGLATAIRLQNAGIETRIFEKRDLPGGRAYVYKDKGYTFDAGPTVITAPECLEELFEIAGRKMKDYVTLLPVTPFYRLMWDDGYVFDYSNDEAEFYGQIRAKNPADEGGYKRFLEYSKEVYAQGYTRLVAQPFLKISDMVKVAPQLMRLGAHRSVYSKVSQYIKDDHLRQAFSFHSLLVGGNPFNTSSIYTLIHYLEKNGGVFFPKGGTGALVQALVKLFEELGGKIRYQAAVDQILTEGAGADRRITGLRLANGEVFECDAVVSNGDVYHTYKDLLRDDSVAAIKAKAVGRKDFSMSLFVLYFGTNKKFDHIKHHSVLFGPRYKNLLKEIFDGGADLPEDFSLYLHRPTESDPDLAPPGGDAFYVLSPVAHLGKLDYDWKNRANEYADKILSYMEEKYMPGLRASIVTQRAFTPLDFKTELNSHIGAAFSLAPTLLQSAYFRMHNRDSKIKGLYFAGAGTHPGAGVPGVINSGKATAGLVIGDARG